MRSSLLGRRLGATLLLASCAPARHHRRDVRRASACMSGRLDRGISSGARLEQRGCAPSTPSARFASCVASRGASGSRTGSNDRDALHAHADQHADRIPRERERRERAQRDRDDEPRAHRSEELRTDRRRRIDAPQPVGAAITVRAPLLDAECARRSAAAPRARRGRPSTSGPCPTACGRTAAARARPARAAGAARRASRER